MFPSNLNHTAWIAVVLLLTSFLLFDSYNWFFVPYPWSTTTATGPISAFAPSDELHSNVSNAVGTASGLNSLKAIRNASQVSQQALSSSVASPNQQSIRNTSAHAVDAVLSSETKVSSYSRTSNAPLSSTADPLQNLGLRKVEAGLRNARAALRKVILDKNTTRALQATEIGDYVPIGSAYRDAAIFRQSYLEMEKRFRIFVYSEGEEPLVHNGPCKEIYSVEGRFIQELQRSNPFVTSDPEEAHVFFMPFSVSMMVTYLYVPNSKNMKPLIHFVKDYVDVIASKHPFWNRSEGADHFMLSCHDWGPHVTRARPDLEKHAIRVLCNADKTESYLPVKDASLPEINLIGGYIQPTLGGPSLEGRPYLAFFAGRDHGPVRPILYKYWEGKDNDVRVFQNLPPEYSYQDFMKKSKFCLCPGGYEVNSPRIVEAIYNDCVPVVIADNFVLPFSDVLDWESFSLRVLEKDIPKLKAILQAVTKERYEQMQEGVRQVQRHFVLNQPPKRYDAFHMILHSVWLRRLNVRLNCI